ASAACAAARRRSAHAARGELAARNRALPRVVGSRILEPRTLALPGLRVPGAGLPPGSDQRIPQSRAIRSARSHARRGDRQEPARDRRGLSQPLPPLTVRLPPPSIAFSCP